MTTNASPMTPLSRHARVHRVGVAMALLGLILVLVAIVIPPAKASTSYGFKGNCVGSATSGTCVLDEPAGRNPAVHGLVTYARFGTTMTFTVDANNPIKEVQICMQTKGVFSSSPKTCAGRNSTRVQVVRAGNTYSVDLKAEGLAKADPLYWTLHVVAGTRTLQVIGQCVPPPTTTTTRPTTTTTKPTTTTSAPTTTTTPPTTTPTTTTSTTIRPTTTTGPTTSTSVPSSTTTSTPTGSTTSSTAAVTTSVPSTTTTTLGVSVLPSDLARTGGLRWWTLQAGAALMLVGLTLVLTVRVVHPLS